MHVCSFLHWKTVTKGEHFEILPVCFADVSAALLSDFVMISVRTQLLRFIFFIYGQSPFENCSPALLDSRNIFNFSYECQLRQPLSPILLYANPLLDYWDLGNRGSEYFPFLRMLPAPFLSKVVVTFVQR